MFLWNELLANGQGVNFLFQVEFDFGFLMSNSAEKIQIIIRW